MKRYLPAILLIASAAVLIAAGIFLNQPESVLHKAVRICMECIRCGECVDACPKKALHLGFTKGKVELKENVGDE